MVFYIIGYGVFILGGLVVLGGYLAVRSIERDGPRCHFCASPIHPAATLCLCCGRDQKPKWPDPPRIVLQNRYRIPTEHRN